MYVYDEQYFHKYSNSTKGHDELGFGFWLVVVVVVVVFGCSFSFFVSPFSNHDIHTYIHHEFWRQQVVCWGE